MAVRGLFGVVPYSNRYARPDASGCFRPLAAAAPLPRDPYATARGLFGVAPYSGAYRPEASSSFRTLQPTPVPPQIDFLSAPDPRLPVYQAREASTILTVNRQIDISTLGIRRFFTTDIPVPAYRTVITMIRGRAGGVTAVPVVPPTMEFLLTDPRQREPLRSDDRIFPPLFKEYEAWGGGAFFATTVPWQGDYPFADASLAIPSIPPLGPSLTPSQRAFATLLSYQSPHLPDSSRVMVSPAGGAPVVPVERRHFATHEWAWGKGGLFYAYDPSKITGPAHQPGTKPIPTNRPLYIPTWRRRRR